MIACAFEAKLNGKEVTMFILKNLLEAARSKKEFMLVPEHYIMGGKIDYEQLRTDIIRFTENFCENAPSVSLSLTLRLILLTLKPQFS